MTPTNTMIPVKLISTGMNTNPRRYFDSGEMAAMQDSMRAVGLTTPILVRPYEGGYQLVAGERRLRNFIIVFGEDSEIPALVREMTDEEALAAALTENVVRTAMTPVEEAEAAAKVLGDCKGDRQEAANRLGWKPDMLNKRLGLMHASDKVRAALQERKVSLGHAELLAACRKESQDAALEHLLLQAAKGTEMTVAALKAYLEKHAQVLEKAIFNKADCAACHHNSENQGALFGEAISTGRCTNKQCFDTKTENEINQRVEALKDEFRVVRIARAGENMTLIPLVADGTKGVGAEQALACKTCQNFGAVVSAIPDKLGNVYKSMCMDVPCNTKHVQAKQKAEKEAQQAADAASKPEGKGNEPPQAANGAKGSTKAAGNASKPAASSEPSNRIKEYREKIWREMYARAIPKLTTQQNRTVLLALCLTRPSVLDSHMLKEVVKPFVGDVTLTSKTSELLAALTAMDGTALATVLGSIAALVSAGPMGLELSEVTGTLKFYDIKVENYWKLGQKFCELLTKSELDAIAQELGIKAAMGDNFKKAYSGSKEDFIKAVLNVEGFEYAGKIPKLMRF